MSARNGRRPTVVSSFSARLASLSFFSLGALVGFFTTLGIVARNGIMQISHFQHLEQHEGETFGMTS